MPNKPLQQTGRTSRLLTRAATGCGRQLSGKVVRRTPVMTVAREIAFVSLLCFFPSCEDQAEPANDLGPLRMVELMNHGGCNIAGGPLPPFEWELRFNCHGAVELDEYIKGSLETSVGTVEQGRLRDILATAGAVERRGVESSYLTVFGPDFYSVRMVFAQGEVATFGTIEALPKAIGVVVHTLSQVKSQVAWRPREK